MNVLFDTNVILDVLLEREPHVGPASKLFALVDRGRIKGSMCATTATTVYYIAAKDFGTRRAREQIHELFGLFEIAPVDRDVLDRALEHRLRGLRRRRAARSGASLGATVIVTRDREDFANSAIPALDPHELLAAVAAAP